MIKYRQKNGVNYVSIFPRKYAGGQTRQITVLKGKSMMFDLQKANMTKRISAFIFDLIITMTLTVAFGAVISFISGYDKHYEACVSVITRYEKEYDLSYYIDENEFTSLSESDRLSYEKMCDAIAKDEDFIYHNHYYFNLSLLIISLGILLAVLVVDFIFPVFLKDGKTIGKKIFGLGVMRTDHVKVSPLFMFIRTFLGKYTIETMVPVLLIFMIYFGMVGLAGTVVIIGLLILQIVCMAVTKTNSCIHDLFAGTVVIDFPAQKIFDTKEELIAAKEKDAAEKAANATY